MSNRNSQSMIKKNRIVQQIPITQQKMVSLMEQRYYILQDLDNVLGIFAETAEIIKFFEEFPDHQMVTNAQNRLITQINLSNTIHFDQKNVDDPLLVGNLKDLKSLAKEYFEEIRQSIPFTDKIDHVADHYVKQNLNENNILQQLPGVQSNSKANFTPETIQKVVEAMNQVDTIMGKIRAGQNVDIPSKEEFKKKMKARQLNAQEKLKQNFKREYEESQKLKQKRGNQIKEEEEQELVIQFSDQHEENVSEVDKNTGQKQQNSQIDPINKYNSDPNQGQQTQNQQQTEKKSQKKQYDQEYKQLINIINKAIIDNLKLLHQQLKQIDLSEYTIQNILNLMKQEAKPEDLLKIFQEIQKLFDENSEMFKLFDQVIQGIPKQDSKINLKRIYRRNIINNDIQQFQDYIEQLEKQYEHKSQQQQQMREQGQKQSPKDLENLKQQTILKHLKLLFNQLNESQFFYESTYRQIIQKMMQEIQIEDLLSIFKDIYQLFPTNSQIYLFFYRILQAIKQENSKISLLEIDRSKIQDNEITQLQNYILALEQRISRQETQNQQQIDKISQQKQQGLENNLQISIINKALIEKLKLLLKELLYQDLYENEIQNILNLMKQDTKPENLIIIFQEIQKLFDENSEMFKLFDQVIQGIPKQDSKINLKRIYRRNIINNDIQQFQDYIEQLEKQYEHKSQQQQQMREQGYNQSPKDLENLKYQTILKHLKLLSNQLNESQFLYESTYQQIIQKMKQEIQIEDLLSIFKDIYQLFPTNSQIYLFFYRILQAIKQENSKISLLEIDRSKIQDNEITQLQNYILALEQRISRQETQNQQQIDKISQQKQQGLENNLQISIINKALIEKLKLLLKELLYQDLYENEIQNILNLMKQDTKPENLIIIFQEIQKLFDENSEMFKLFDQVIQGIPKQDSKINLKRIYRRNIINNDIQQFQDYIEQLEKQYEHKSQQQQQMREQGYNQSPKDLENLKYQTILKHLKLLSNQLNESQFLYESTYQQIIQKMKQEIQIEDLLSIFKDIYQLFPTNSQIYLFFYRILQAIKQENSKISLSGICRSKIEDNQITQLQNYILALEQRISRQETQNQQQIDKISQQNSEQNRPIIVINKRIIELLNLLHEEFQYSDLSERTFQSLIENMKLEIQTKDLIIIFQEIQKLFDRNSEMSKLFNLIIQNIPERQVKIYISGINRFKIEADEIKRLANYIKKLEVEGKMQI